MTCEDDILCGVNRPNDPANLTDLEKKHIPQIKAPDSAAIDEFFDVTVEVGKLVEHPNEPGHFIEWIELYSGDTFLIRLSLAGKFADPVLNARVRLTHEHPLKAWAKCNLHGLWEGIKEIKTT